MKKILTLLLLSAMLLSTFAACSESETNADEGTVSGDTGVSEAAAAEEETEYVETLDVEVKDYEGRTINIVLAGNWSFTDFIAENDR